MDNGGGYLPEDAVGDVMYMFGLSPLFELSSGKRSDGNGGTAYQNYFRDGNIEECFDMGEV